MRGGRAKKKNIVDREHNFQNSKKKTEKKTHTLESNETFWTPSDVNISSDPPPKNPALLRRTTPFESVTFPPLLIFFFSFGRKKGEIFFFRPFSLSATSTIKIEKKLFFTHAMTERPPLFIPEKQSSTTKSLIGPRPPVEASTVQTEPKWKPPF